MSDTVTDVKAYEWCAEGQWRDVSGGKLFDDFEPYTGNLYARVAECGAEEARLAIAEILARKTGRTIPFSTFQQDLVAPTLEQAANWVYLPTGEGLASNLADTQSIGADVLVEIANRASAGNPS
jgi:hypothetical protein